MRLCLLLLIIFPMISSAESSKCYGTTRNGSISDAVKLPSSGKNYKGYSLAARIAGRTYVHSEVSKIVIASYESLETSEPKKVYKYAETGLKNGGIFKPHKTHHKKGNSVHLPTNSLNKFGYNIEFDSNNKFKHYSIDFIAMAAHIVELHKQAKKNGHDLWRVILAPELQPYLYETEYAEYLRANVQFSKKRSWVRHDEHYHVDFAVVCE